MDLFTSSLGDRKAIMLHNVDFKLKKRGGGTSACTYCKKIVEDTKQLLLLGLTCWLLQICVRISLNLIYFFSNSRSFIKIHWSNTRCVCTHLNAVFKLNQNMTRKMWSSKLFSDLKTIDLSALDKYVVSRYCRIGALY